MKQLVLKSFRDKVFWWRRRITHACTNAHSTCANTRTQSHTNAHTRTAHTYTRAHTKCTRTHIQKKTKTHTYTHTHTYTYTHTHTHTHTHTYAHTLNIYLQTMTCQVEMQPAGSAGPEVLDRLLGMSALWSKYAWCQDTIAHIKQPYTHTCTPPHAHTHAHAHAPTHVHAHAPTHVHAHTRIHTRTHTLTTHTHTHTHAYTHAHTTTHWIFIMPTTHLIDLFSQIIHTCDITKTLLCIQIIHMWDMANSCVYLLIYNLKKERRPNIGYEQISVACNLITCNVSQRPV